MSLLRIGRYGPEDLGRQPFLIGHALTGHHLFALDRMLALACRLPLESTEHSVDPGLTPATGLSLEQTIRRIEYAGAWVALKNVEADPHYRLLLDRCLDEVEAACGEEARGMSLRAGSIFITSPGTIAPYQLDAEQSFLLQIQGRKAMHISDRKVLPDTELERHLTGGHRNVRLPAKSRPPARSFLLSPREGVHVPCLAPHWEVNGEEVSISFSIAFQTPSSRKDLRQAGTSSSSPERSKRVVAAAQGRRSQP